MTHDDATADYFQPRCEPGSLFGNEVEHLPEPAVRMPAGKIVVEPGPELAELVKRRRISKRNHAEWAHLTFGD